MSSSPTLLPVFLAEEEGEAIWYLGGLLTIKVSGATTAGAFDMIEGLMPPGATPPPHIHHWFDESFFVLEGSFTLILNGTQHIAAERGAFVFIPRGTLHSFRVESTTPGRVLSFTNPTGLSGFFREIGEPARERTLPPPLPFDPQKVARVALKYGTEMPGLAGAPAEHAAR